MPPRTPKPPPPPANSEIDPDAIAALMETYETLLRDANKKGLTRKRMKALLDTYADIRWRLLLAAGEDPTSDEIIPHVIEFTEDP